MFFQPEIKGWDMDDEEPPQGRDAKFSWEVIRDNSIFTYRIDLVPAYAEVMAALQVREVDEKSVVREVGGVLHIVHAAIVQTCFGTQGKEGGPAMKITRHESSPRETHQDPPTTVNA